MSTRFAGSPLLTMVCDGLGRGRAREAHDGEQAQHHSQGARAGEAREAGSLAHDVHPQRAATAPTSSSENFCPSQSGW